MEVTALCIQILMKIFVLLSTLFGQGFTIHNPGFPIISPDRLQFFEYESVFVNCGGDKDMNGWSVKTKSLNISPNMTEICNIPAPSCTIDYIFERHTGEYWCENDEGERSLAFNISVTAGLVILDFAARPMNEGSNVTLRCINQNNEHTQITDFFKDGLHLITTYENVLNLPRVSKSDEGLYRCSISEAGDSAESWLAVVKQKKGSDEVTQHLRPLIILLPQTMAFIFLLIGLTVFRKYYGRDAANRPDTSAGYRKREREVHTASIGQHSSEQQPTCSEDSI